ncbi:Single-stranded DNA-binding protein (Ssb) [Fructobacillus tropaeoli]|nr:Single-stranded DNA-binding protein (Ssb) [Fructobacillus tropaeoli]
MYVTEVVVDNFSLLESKAEADKRREENGMSQAAQQSTAPAHNGGIDISDSDLPF